MILADREFYNVGESLVVQCGIGYRPSYERISCINGQADVEWDHSPQCIGEYRRTQVSQILGAVPLSQGPPNLLSCPVCLT